MPSAYLISRVAGSSVYVHLCCFQDWSCPEDSPVPRVHIMRLTDCRPGVCSALQSVVHIMSSSWQAAVQGQS